MKVIKNKDMITVITFENYKLSIDDYIKKIILKLKKKYKVDIFGIYEINVYKNKKIGMIIDFIKEDDFGLFSDLLDFNINIIETSDIYLRFNDYFLETKEKFYLLDDNYYINIDAISYHKFLNMLEFSSFIYGEEANNIKNKLVVR